MRHIAIFVCLTISLLNTALKLGLCHDFLYSTELVRPWVVLFCFSHMRSTFYLIVLNIRDSFVTMLIIFLFILYFSFFASFIFYTTFEGAAFTNLMGESYWQFLILLTTENYPDFVLLAYNWNFLTILFFLTFIFISIFYLYSILLSIVFNNYKQSIEEIH